MIFVFKYMFKYILSEVLSDVIIKANYNLVSGLWRIGDEPVVGDGIHSTFTKLYFFFYFSLFNFTKLYLLYLYISLLNKFQIF